MAVEIFPVSAPVMRARQWPIIAMLGWSLLAAGCANQAQGPGNASAWDQKAYENAISWSGESEASQALADRLRVSCNLSAMSPDPSADLKTGALAPLAYDADSELVAFEDADHCVRTRVIAAFDAAEGEPFCNQEINLDFFVACIVNGAYATRVAQKLGIPMSAQTRWADRTERQIKIQQAVFDRTFMKCLRRTQSEADRCAEDIYLPLLELERSDISKCPSGEMRGICIGKSGVAHFVQSRVTLIF